MKQFNSDEMLDNKLLTELKKEIPIDMLSEEERRYIINQSNNSILQAVKLVSKLHPDFGLKISKTYCDLYLDDILKHSVKNV